MQNKLFAKKNDQEFLSSDSHNNHHQQKSFKKKKCRSKIVFAFWVVLFLVKMRRTLSLLSQTHRHGPRMEFALKQKKTEKIQEEMESRSVVELRDELADLVARELYPLPKRFT
jgi:hypothetical protein